MDIPEARNLPVAYVEQPCKSALNPVRGMGFSWSLNPYMGCEHRCVFCYVRAYEKRADRPSDDGYGRAIRVKTNVAEVLRRELSKPGWQGETIVLGAATDPYQPAEGRYRLTRSCLEVLRDFSNPVGIITRGPMVVRDIDILREVGGRANLSLNFSIPTLDTDVWRRTEPGTAPPRQRLRALERLVGSGIRAGVAMAPLLPGLSDRPEQVEEVVKAARQAGATHLWAGVLYLKEGTREHFMSCLQKHWPELLPWYRSAYATRSYLPTTITSAAMDRVSRARSRHRIGDRRTQPLRPPPPPPKPSQLLLPI